MKKTASVSISEELLEKIDRVRGLVSRSAYLEDLIPRKPSWLLGMVSLVTDQHHQMSNLITISIEQQKAVDLLIEGYKDREVAEKVGVTRETVSRWRSDHPGFKAELYKRRKEMQDISKDRLMIVVQKAIGVAEEMIMDADNPNRGKMAMDLIKAILDSPLMLADLPLIEAEDIIQALALNLSIEEVCYPLMRETDPRRAAAIDKIRDKLEGGH